MVIRVAVPWFYSPGTVACGRGKEKMARSPARAQTRVRIGYAGVRVGSALQRQGREGDGVGKGTGPLVELSPGGRREAAR